MKKLFSVLWLLSLALSSTAFATSYQCFAPNFETVISLDEGLKFKFGTIHLNVSDAPPRPLKFLKGTFEKDSIDASFRITGLKLGIEIHARREGSSQELNGKLHLVV